MLHFGYRSRQQFFLQCAISKFWINREMFVVFCMLPRVGLQLDSFPHSSDLLPEHKAFIFILQ